MTVTTGQGNFDLKLAELARGQTRTVLDGQATVTRQDATTRLTGSDWGLWRTSRQTIERCIADVGNYDLTAEQQETIADRMRGLWERIDAEPKSGKWKMRNRVGDRKRWYEEPDEVGQGGY